MDERWTNAEGTGPGPRPSQRATPQLSCALCRDRKLKCDKLDPCTNCNLSGVVCVPIYRPRLARGRHAHRGRRNSSPPGNREQAHSQAHNATDGNDSLSERIRRLESLVLGAGSAARDADTSEAGRSREPQPVEGLETRPIALALASPMTLGSTLSAGSRRQSLSVQQPGSSRKVLVEESQAIRPGTRDTMQLTLGEADANCSQASDSVQADAVDGGISALGLFWSSNQSLASRQTASFSLNKEVAEQLCQVYLQNFDPIIKILHRPSLTRWMQQREQYLGYPEGHTSVETLGSAVCYSAANSLTENQCQAMFHTNKSSIVMACRRICEAAITRSGLLVTRDITVLQAFVLYLAGRRAEDNSTAVWTLVALAVRIAKALGLGQDLDDEIGPNETFFDRQMRKRLWFTICLMDFQASLAQSSEPLVSYKEAGSSLTHVKHVNDSDFDPTTTHLVPDREGLTDTTFALITYRVQLAGRLLNFAEPEATGSSGGSSSSRGSVTSLSSTLVSEQDGRQQQARRFEQEALSLLHFCDPESSSYAWFTWHSTQCLIAAVRFFTLRPLRHAQAGTGSGSQTPAQPEGDTELLRRALFHLEKVQLVHTDPRSEGYRWYIAIPWPALAAAIAECNVCTDAALVRRAWPLIEASYQHYETALSRHSSEMLQGSLAQLMHRTRENLAMLVHDGHGVSGSANLATVNSPAQALAAPQPTSADGPVTGEIPAKSAKAMGVPPTTSSEIALEAVHPASTRLPPEQIWDSNSFLLDSQPMSTSSPSGAAAEQGPSCWRDGSHDWSRDQSHLEQFSWL